VLPCASNSRKTRRRRRRCRRWRNKAKAKPRRSEPGNEVENCNSKMFALGYEKKKKNKTKNNKSGVCSALEWSVMWHLFGFAHMWHGLAD